MNEPQPLLFPETKPLKILLSAYTGLGNFVLKTPAIQQLNAALPPGSSIDLIGGNTYGSDYVLRGSPLIGQTHLLKPTASWPKKVAFFAGLRKYKYDVIVLPFDAQPNFLLYGSYIAGISHRLLHQKPPFTHRRYPLPASVCLPVALDRHEIDLNFDLFQLLFRSPAKLIRHYNTIVKYETDTTALTRFGLEPQKYIALQPGAANGNYRAKVWPTERFAALINQLAPIYDGKIVLVGDQGDRKHSIEPLLPHIQPNHNAQKVIDTAGKTDFNTLINILANATLVVCHDSGIMHLSDALATPLIALYGPTDTLRTGPLKASSEVLYSETPYKHITAQFAYSEAELEPLGHAPMEGLYVNDVLAAIVRRMKGHEKNKDTATSKI